ncbi:penicillin-binding protein 1C [Roseomonas sp. CECT 9278]|uniref:penicillin-binding protein 1C n=1 Tax=Roseomonas sp. CECT 9278 TaxID=2845823 RepID=UPI001E29AC5B|nr:penicillin-binding protein 1C [Roseomonas sp. CECT 9278]
MGAALLLAVTVILAVLALDRISPPDLSRLHAAGVEVFDRDGRTLSVLPAPGGVWRLRTAVADVPPVLVELLVAAEDRRFRSHVGVDPVALGRAVVQWVRAGRVVSGGSTLTMQAARLLEPRPRTLRSKLIEIFRAVQLEARFSKDEILGIWLTLAPQGGNIEGMRAGALAWFGRPAARLDAAESALLVALARRPASLRPDRHPDAARAARDAVLARRGGPAAGMSEADRALSIAAAMPDRRRDMPRLAPHLAREMARGAAGSVALTLDAALQRATERLARDILPTLPDRAALAIVVADVATREVRALIGGEWGAESRAGALDLTRAVRSPGSALKPFLYAMAFERGIATPGTIVADLPRHFGEYAPENFSRDFAGRVTAAQALRMSLNLPAVALLDQVGALRFASALKAAGAAPRLPPGADASLPLALGGAGTTLREMVALYATLADHGRARPLRLVAGPSAEPQGARAPAEPHPSGTPATSPVSTTPTAFQQVVERRAADAVAAILVQPFPGGGPAGVAWKTGTSWGGRDAWALGFDARHVAGVWIGRPDGTAMPGATGRQGALPVLARVFALLPEAPRQGLRVVADAPRQGAPADRLRLLFPPPGAALADGAGPVVLRAAGGRRPLAFLVDGAPLRAEAARREVAWTPPGPGAYRITVLDADGVAASVGVRVRGPDSAPTGGITITLVPASVSAPAP